MKLYLDDDSADKVVVKLLRQAGHDVEIPADSGMAGARDASHLAHAVRQGRICLTRNHSDFRLLHELIIAAQGQIPGIVVVRRDNDPTRDLSPKGIITAIRKLEAAGVPIANEYIVLNHWR